MAMRGIDSSADIEPNIESHLPPLNPLPPPPAATRATALRAAALTRTFRSEPHLDIPHFVHGQDPLHVSSLTRVLSGLTQVDSALSTPFSSSKRCLDSGVNSCPHPQVVVDDSAIESVQSKQSSSLNCNNKERQSIASSPYQQQQLSIRKSNSSTAIVCTSSPISGKQPDEHLTLSSSSSIQQYTPSFHRDSNGLTMSTIAAHSGKSLAVPSSHQHPNESVIATAGIPVPSTSTAASDTASPGNSPDSRNQQHHGVLGVFGRGFFAKPVIRSEEENYRYLMALDR